MAAMAPVAGGGGAGLGGAIYNQGTLTLTERNFGEQSGCRAATVARGFRRQFWIWRQRRWRQRWQWRRRSCSLRVVSARGVAAVRGCEWFGPRRMAGFGGGDGNGSPSSTLGTRRQWVALRRRRRRRQRLRWWWWRPRRLAAQSLMTLAVIVIVSSALSNNTVLSWQWRSRLQSWRWRLRWLSPWRRDLQLQRRIVGHQLLSAAALNNAASGGAVSYTRRRQGIRTRCSLIQSTVSDSTGSSYFANVINGGFSQTIGNSNSVSSHNDPWIDDIPDQTVITQAAVNFGVSAPINPGSYSVQVHSLNQSVLADSGLVLSGSGTNRTLTITPTSSQSGTVTVIATVTDGTVSIADLFQVTIPTNHAPVATNDLASVTNGDSVTVNVLQNDSDPDGDPSDHHRHHAASRTVRRHLPPPMSPTVNNGNLATNDSFTYTISDGRGGSATGTVSIVIIHPNHNPVAVDDTGLVTKGGTTTITASPKRF